MSDLLTDRGRIADDADSEDESDLSALTATEFRAVSTSRSRKGLRLEKAFWVALETIGQWMGLKRHKLVGKIVEEAERRELNTASALRSYAIDMMHREIRRLASLNDETYTIRLLQQAPVPSFAVDRTKHVLSVNAEFNHYVRILFAETRNAAPRRSLQLNLETPVHEVFDALGTGEGEGKVFGLSIVVDGRAKRVRTRIVAIPPHAPDVLVGYIIS